RNFDPRIASRGAFPRQNGGKFNRLAIARSSESSREQHSQFQRTPRVDATPCPEPVNPSRHPDHQISKSGPSKWCAHRSIRQGHALHACADHLRGRTTLPPNINRRATATAAASRHHPRTPTSTRRTDDAPPREPDSNSTGGVVLAAHDSTGGVVLAAGRLARLRQGPYARWVPNQLENAGRVAVSTQICEAVTETGR